MIPKGGEAENRYSDWWEWDSDYQSAKDAQLYHLCHEPPSCISLSLSLYVFLFIYFLHGSVDFCFVWLCYNLLELLRLFCCIYFLFILLLWVACKRVWLGFWWCACVLWSPKFEKIADNYFSIIDVRLLKQKKGRKSYSRKLKCNTSFNLFKNMFPWYICMYLCIFFSIFFMCLYIKYFLGINS